MVCTKCKKDKPDSEFRVYRTYKSHCCNDCDNLYKRNWRREKKPDVYALYERERLIAEGKNKCNICERVLPLSMFKESTRTNSRLGYMNRCKDCYTISDKFSKLKNTYGLYPEHYAFILNYQNNKCAVCKRGFLNDKVCVDHNHQTNKVRGLLCDNCNRGLGLLADSEEILQNAIQYLRDHLKLDELLETLPRSNKLKVTRAISSQALEQLKSIAKVQRLTGEQVEAINPTRASNRRMLLL